MGWYVLRMQRADLFSFGIVAILVTLAGCGAPPAEEPAPEPSAPAEQSPISTPTPTPEPPRTVSVAMTGDLLWHNTLWFGAQEDAREQGRTGADDYDFTPLLAGVQPVIEDVDLGICHNEVPVGNPGGPYSNYPVFIAPPYTLDAAKAVGYDLCTTGSNHSLDDGWDGVSRTLDAMDERGLLHVGTARSAEEAERPTIFTTDAGVKVAVVEGTYGTNGIPLPEGKPWAVADIDPDRLLARAHDAREAGADIVMVAVHGGEEYQTEPNQQQTDLAEKLTASDDVDLVYGHHAHVVQPITQVNGTWVAYGLGNLVAQHSTDVPRGYEGIVTRFTFTESESGSGRFTVQDAEYFPTLVTSYSSGSPARLHLVNESLERGQGDADRLRTAKQRTEEAVNSLGGNDGLEQR